MTQKTEKTIYLETQDHRKALMVNSFGTAMRLESLPLDKYVGLLQSYTVIHRALEGMLRSSPESSVVTVWRDDLSGIAAIERDLKFFDVTAESGPASAIASAERLTGEIRGSSGVALLGYLYAMASSTLDAEAMLRRHVESAFALDADHGTAYFNSANRARWHEFNDRLNSVVVEHAEQEAVLDAAVVTYQSVLAVQENLL